MARAAPSRLLASSPPQPRGTSPPRGWWEAAASAGPPQLPGCVIADAEAALGGEAVLRLRSVAAAYTSDFGFQESVAAHQCEHLLGLLAARARRSRVDPGAAAVGLHAELFEPYLAWCEHVGAVPRCSSATSSSSSSSSASSPETCEAETLLYLLVWAESANLRHAPEAVWWSFHQLSKARALHLPFLAAVVAPLYASAVFLFRERSPALNYDDLNEAFWQPRCLSWAIEGTAPGSAAAELRRLRKTYRERRSWLHVLGSFERVYFAHWLMLRAVLSAALGAHTCVAAEFGSTCDAEDAASTLLRVLQLESTCIVDFQAYRVLSGLLRLWMRFADLEPARLLDAVLRVAADLLLSLALNLELWYALRTSGRLHWAVVGALSLLSLGLPTLATRAERHRLRSLNAPGARAARARRAATAEAAADAAGGGGDARSAEEGRRKSRRLLALLGAESVGGQLPPRPHERVSWRALAFWASLFATHCAVSYWYIAGQLVVDTLGLFYSYFGRSLTGASGIGGGQLGVLLLCIWVPVVLFFLVSFSLTFSLWVLGVGLYRGAAKLRVARERGVPELLHSHFDPAADRLERRFLHTPAAPRSLSEGTAARLDEASEESRSAEGGDSPGLGVGLPGVQRSATEPRVVARPPPQRRAVSASASTSTGASSLFCRSTAAPSDAEPSRLRPGDATSPRLRPDPSPHCLRPPGPPAAPSWKLPTLNASLADASPTRRLPSPVDPDVSGAALLGRLPASGGWGFAQTWNRMLSEMRAEDLVSDQELAHLQFAIVPRAHPSAGPLPATAETRAAGGGAYGARHVASARLHELPPAAPLPPPHQGGSHPHQGVPLQGSQLPQQGGSHPSQAGQLPHHAYAAIPPLLPLLLPPPLGSLKRALDLLLGGASFAALPTLCSFSLVAACEVAAALAWPLLGAMHQPDVAAAADALLAVLPPLLRSGAGCASPADALPPALRSERVVRGFRKALLALCDAIEAMLREAAEAKDGPETGLTGAQARSSAWATSEAGKGRQEAGLTGAQARVYPNNRRQAAAAVPKTSGVAALLAEELGDAAEPTHGSRTRPARASSAGGLPTTGLTTGSMAALRDAIHSASTSSLCQLRTCRDEASAYASVSMRELERMRAQVSLQDLSRLDLTKLDFGDLATDFGHAARAKRSASELAGAGGAAARAAALPSIQQALASLLACMQHASLAAARDSATPGGPAARGALSRGAAALQRSLAQPHAGFWADSAYAHAALLELLRLEPQLGALAGRLRGLLSLRTPSEEPLRSAEAMRRVRFFLRSLAMEAPPPPPVAQMASWSILTPVHKETILYSLEELGEESNDGIPFLQVLRELHPYEWANFVTRMGLPRGWLAAPAAVAADAQLALHVRLWASLRGQTLARTVLGMMHYESALVFLAQLEHGEADMPRAAAVDLARRTVRYVCACQVYGDYRRAADPRARDIELLLHACPSLRVAYVDKQPAAAATDKQPAAAAAEWSAALVRSDGRGGVLCECRVALPGDPILGEGKPENQNVSLPFCHGEKVQLVDMNQEGYWEEAIKMRCLLQEFGASANAKGGRVTIVGFPEHIFTQSSGFVTAIFMGVQERFFGSFVQRVLDEPLDVRLHYGHPDVVDKLHFLTRGGVSKASKEINLSEDVFGGIKTVLSAGSVVFREYHQVGKGRPTNLNEITGFFAKLSSGCAASVTTRDVARLAAAFPLARLCSFYYSCIAFYLHDAIVLHVTVLVPYLLALLALVGLDHEFNNYDAQPFSLFAMMPLVLALTTCIPALVMVWYERGPRRALSFLLGMVITASPVYFVFISQTKSYHFARTVTAGGATYFAARRNASVLHTPLHELYANFAPSHLYVSADVFGFLSVAHVFSVSTRLVLTTWPTWCVAACFVTAPLLYNPQQLEWWQLRADARAFKGWLTGGGWEAWYEKRHAPPTPGGMAAEEAAWNEQFGRALVAAYYCFIASLIPRKADPRSAANGGWLCDPIFVAAALALLAALIALAAADLRPHGAAQPPSPRRRRACHAAAAALAALGLGAGVAAALQPNLPPGAARKRAIVACLFGYVCAASLASVLELLAAIQLSAPAAAPLLRLVHKARDCALGAAILFPLCLLAALRLPGRVHKALIFQRSFVDLDARGQLLYAAVLLAAALAYLVGRAI